MSVNKKPLLPPEVTLLLKRSLIKFVGIIILCSGLFCLVAVLSFRSSDPSLNTASAGPVANILGLYGAFAADLLLQFLGLSSFIICLFLMQTGFILIKEEKLKLLILKLFAMIGAVVLFSGFLAGFNNGKSWPVMAGMGGSVGYIINLNAVKIIPLLKLPQGLTWLVALLLGLLALFLGFYCFGIDSTFFKKIIYKLNHIKNNIKAILQNNFEFFAKEETPLEKPKLIAKLKPAQEKSDDSDNIEEEEDDDDIIRKEPYLVERSKEKTASETKSKANLNLAKPSEYIPPSLNLLSSSDDNKKICDLSDEELNQIARELEKTLNEFGIKGEIVKIRPGPVVTLYELDPAPGTKTSRVVGLADDIARSMSAISVRIAVVIGSNTIGIELPNEKRKTVYLKDLLSSPEAQSKNPLTLVLGKDIGGKNIFADLAKMPHLLIAGTTGSGKSVAVNSMILSLLFRLSPKECRLIMIDPKMLEFTPYNGIPHLLTPVVTDPAKAVIALKWAVREMEDRYKAMSILSVRNIETYNAKLQESLNNNEKIMRTVQTGFDSETGNPIYEEQELDLSFFPYIVVIVDEMADLMMVAGKDVEAAIQRLAQMARAAGIHIIMATQRPSVDVITGTIKANFPTRISFNVTSRIDSRTILGEQGAEQLLGRGDMLYMPSGMRPIRIHGPFVDDKERDAVIKYLKELEKPEYINAVIEDNQPPSDFEKAMNASAVVSSGDDELYDQAVAIVLSDRKVSTSYIQRRLRIGYNRAAELVEKMEREGLISPANHVGKREILVPEQENF